VVVAPSRMRMEAVGAISVALRAAKNPAAPPPMTIRSYVLDWVNIEIGE